MSDITRLDLFAAAHMNGCLASIQIGDTIHYNVLVNDSFRMAERMIAESDRRQDKENDNEPR